MRMFKKIAACSLTAALAAASLSSFTANGIYINWGIESVDYQNFLNEHVEFECDSLLNMYPYAEKYIDAKCYYSPDSQSEYVVLGEEASCIHVLIPTGTKPTEFQSIVNEVAPDYSVRWCPGSYSRLFSEIATNGDVYYEIKCTDIEDDAFETGQRILEALKEKTEIRRFQFESGDICPTYFNTSTESVTDYEYNPETDGDIGTMLTEFVKENGLDFTVIVEETARSSGDTMRCNLIPGESVTREEQWAVSKQIGENFHIGVWFGTPLSSAPYDGTTIEMAANIAGDANNDGELGIADATLVLQSIGNADKYSLSAQGEYNADVNCDGNVTALDALEIQKMDAKLK